MRAKAVRALGGFSAAILAWFGVSSSAVAEWALNFQPPVTKIAEDIYDLHMIVLWVCTWIGAAVFAVMMYSIFKHRKSKGHEPAQFHESTTVEIIWTIVPFVILIAIAIPATSTMIDFENTSKSDMTIKVTGYQWRWQYEYVEHDINFYSVLSTPRDQVNDYDGDAKPKGENYLLEVDKELVLPVGKKVRFLLTAEDVLHAWWVPALGIKRDTIPGFVNELHATIDKVGVYRGQCAELCGRDHGFMPIVVRAVSQEDFDKWVAEQGGKTAQAQLPTDAPANAPLVADATAVSNPNPAH